MLLLVLYVSGVNGVSPATRQDCGECHYCKDKRKFGGPGRLKTKLLNAPMHVGKYLNLVHT